MWYYDVKYDESLIWLYVL